MDNIPKGEIRNLMGNMNAKLGADNTGRELTMGREAYVEMNDNVELFASQKRFPTGCKLSSTAAFTPY